MKHLWILIGIQCLFIQKNIAQSQFAGNWIGNIKAGKSLRLVFHIVQTGDKLSGTMDSPDQGVTNISCKDVVVKNDSVVVDMSDIGIMYAGKMQADSIVGAWYQAGMVVNLNLKKANKPITMYRPQTPTPPFNYVSEDVIYYNNDKSIQYGATITMPKGKGPFPSVLLITGSGQQNRDEELFGHKPFAVIADYLTKHGYLVMRVDDRGVDKTTGDVFNATTKDFAGDVSIGVDYLKSRKEVNAKKIILMGHSEGGIIAPMVASQRKDIYAIVLLAGAGEKITKLMEEQSAAIIETAQPDSGMVNKYKELYRGMEDAVLAAKDSNDAQNRIKLVLDRWLKEVTPDMAKEIGLNSEANKDRYVSSFTEMYTNPWFHYFLSIDPVPYLQGLSCKVLAINGSKDVQVVPKSNLAGIKQALLKSKSKAYEIKELPGLNHLFQQCKTCTSNEYGELTETISPEALKVISDWLDKNVKTGS